MKNRIDRFFKFITYDVWRITESEVDKTKFFLYSVIKTIYLSLTRFENYRLMRQASALTYSTLLAIVPIVALLFAIAKGFGMDTMMEEQVMSALESNKQAAEFIIGFVSSYLEQAKSGVFIGIGLIMLLWTVINLINNIEDVFNGMWEVKHSRTLYRKITDYFSMLLIVPIVIVVSGGMSLFINKFVAHTESFFLLAPVVKFLIKSVPYVIIWLIFTGLYMFMPNIKVKFTSAFIAAVIAGTAYQLFQILYINSQVWVTGYNAVYGSFAALPLFLIWLQLSWTIVLFGAELTYSIQNMHKYSFDHDIKNVSRRYSDFVSLIVCSVIFGRFERNMPPYTSTQIAEECKLPIRLVRRTLRMLTEVEIIHETFAESDEEERAYQPSVDISVFTVDMLMLRVYTNGSEHFKINTDVQYVKQWNTLNESLEKCYEEGRKTLIKDLL